MLGQADEDEEEEEEEEENGSKFQQPQQPQALPAPPPEAFSFPLPADPGQKSRQAAMSKELQRLRQLAKLVAAQQALDLKEDSTTKRTTNPAAEK